MAGFGSGVKHSVGGAQLAKGIKALLTDIRAGIDASREIIHSGRAMQKLTDWVSIQADGGKTGIRRFTRLAREAGVEEKVNAWL